jgi:hypothetical protein
MQHLQTPQIPHHRIATIVTLLVCYGALGMATAARAQTVTPRLGAPPFAPGDPPRETVPQLYDGPDSQRPVGFAPQDRWGMYHLLPVAAAESSADGRGGSGGVASSDPAELAKKLQNPIADLISVPLQNNWDFGICHGVGAARSKAQHGPVRPGHAPQNRLG